MGPVWMAFVLASLLGIFAATAFGRLTLIAGARPLDRMDRIPERVNSVLEYVFAQRKIHYYRLAGLAHHIIFIGFATLLFRTLILWGRGFDPTFNLWILGPEPVLGIPLGHIYEFIKEIAATAVVFGASVFVYLRVVKREKRMTLSTEGLVILGIIVTMMVSDMLYDGAAIALHHRYADAFAIAAKPTGTAWLPEVAIFAHRLAEPVTGAPTWAPFPAPAGSLFAVLLQHAPTSVLTKLAHLGFWTHATLVLVFLNILPYSKHFHILTVVPNVFFRDLENPGRLPLMARTAEGVGELVMKAVEEPQTATPVGAAKIGDFSWKAVLDFYTCTECGRCSDNCPAHRTGKLLSPKQLTIDLRNHLYEGQAEVVGGRASSLAEGEGSQKDLVPNVINPDVLWACTTCRACEEQCPVMISYVDKIVEMRRGLVMVKGEFPAELGNVFQAIEVNGNPWNLARMDRAAWADGLDVPLIKDNPKAPVLYWVGCAASYDDRAKKVARATAALLKQAGVDFAILGQEETCTGDPARRAGNEYLFAQLAEQNVQTLNGYQAQGGIRTIVATCPHCFNSLKNEYPDFGAHFEVVHHTDFLLGLVAQGKLKPTKPVQGRVAYHDSCYLGRYNDIFEPPREILKRIPGLEVVEAGEDAFKKKGLCCGAGGAQMWMEEQNKDRMNVRRTLQLLENKPTAIATACPFCQTMITDGLKSEGKEDTVRQLDVVELLSESCIPAQASLS